MDHYQEILNALSAIASARSIRSIESYYRSIALAANRFSGGSRKNAPLMLLVADLNALIQSEKQLAAIEQRGDGPTEGFFKSFAVLRSEFERALRS